MQYGSDIICLIFAISMTAAAPRLSFFSRNCICQSAYQDHADGKAIETLMTYGTLLRIY